MGRSDVVWEAGERLFQNLAFLAAGSALCALAINGILVPHGFLSGGVAGVALEIHYLVPKIPVSWAYLALNVPLFAVAWRFVGRRFFLYSLVGAVLFTLALDWIHWTVPVEDRMLAALLAGILSGAGSGLILRSRGSAGGTDVLSVMLYQRFSVRLGTTVLVFNAVVLGVGAAIFGLDPALYTLVHIFVASRGVDLVVTGLSQRKAAFIVSRRWEEILRHVLGEIGRGVTVLEAHGGYTGEEEHVLYTVITFREWPRLKRAVRAIDPEAFVVVTDTLEVLGQRIGNEPHW
ncbi:YitT family protein [Deferrisoma sp.]